MTLKQIVMLISLAGPWMITCEKSYKDYSKKISLYRQSEEEWRWLWY